MPKNTNDSSESTATEPYADLQSAFAAAVRSAFAELKGEISERNQKIAVRDNYVYGDQLEKSLDIPIGHDKTPVNWLRRTVEIHKTQFMGRPFQLISTYNTKDTTTAADEDDAGRLEVENKKLKEYAELRKQVIDDIIRDNGGHSLFMECAESASAVGDVILKTWYDDKAKKFVISPVEAVENCYALWSKDDFREFDAFGYIYQVSKQRAIDDFGVSEDCATSVMGEPLEFIGEGRGTVTVSTQPMVTIIEVTGRVPGWASDKGRLKRVGRGKETELNAVIVGNGVQRLIDDPKKLPRYYILPNKKQRRRAWGVSDISDAAIYINQSYIEVLSDWRTVANKVNFPKFKGFNFGPDTQMPKYKSRAVQFLPLAEGQDIQLLQQGDANNIDFKTQMDELKEQFVRETGISRVLFDDPSVTLNSNQALLTSMKPTSDIAETKKQLWGPILTRLFTDAIETIGQFDDTVKELADSADPWTLKIQWPSIMQKEDPVYQQMLLNRFNAKTISLTSYLEAQGETKEEVDRIREEMKDQVTAAILGNQVPLLAQQLIAPPPPPQEEKPKINVSLRGDLTPMQEAEIAAQSGFNSTGEMGPQGAAGLAAQENADNQGFINGNAFAGGTPNFQNINSNGGTSAPAQVNTQANNVPGTGVTSQPGSGATTTSAQGALNQANQQQGQ